MYQKVTATYWSIGSLFSLPVCESPLAEQLERSEGVNGFKIKYMMDYKKMTQLHSSLGMESS